MKPNLLKFANEALKNKTCPITGPRLTTYNMNTGEMSPDTGFYLPVIEKKYSGVDKDSIREFWGENSALLAREYMCIGILWSGEAYVYSVGMHMEDRELALYKGRVRGFQVWDNAKGDTIESDMLNF